MKTWLIMLLIPYIALGQDSSYTIQRSIPVKIIPNPLNLNHPRDTVLSTGLSTLGHESKNDMLAKLADTVYLNKIVGVYLIGNSGPEIRINRRKNVLSILIPGYAECELVPMTSSLFSVEGKSDAKIFLFFDRRNNIPAINIQTTMENYSANRKDYKVNN